MSFNPRTRVGCDLVLRCHCFADHRFQSTHPRGVRRVKFRSFPMRFSMFQSTHPRGVRRRTQRHQRELRRFNPRTRVGCDDTDMYLYGLECRFQSTHPRGVRHASCFITLTYTDVSIHAPAWGATSARKDSRLPPSVSIHAPAWGATIWFLLTSSSFILFQSTHPRGVRRPGHWAAGRRKIGFNPRTRVGCDLPTVSMAEKIHWFQSTHPRGVRPVCGIVVSKRTTFQSTHPRGVRHATTLRPPARGRSFNPRTRVGCDPPGAPGAAGAPVSIHAPAWGATVAPAKNFQQAAFQSTHPRGVRQKSCWQRSSPFLFQSTHPRGVRPVKPIARKEKPSFQSTHPRGVRRIRNVQIRTDHWVSIHAPAWGATVNA